MDNDREECSFLDCGRRIRSAGLCSGHYYQQYRGQTLRPLRGNGAGAQADSDCAVDECTRQAVSNGLCQGHRKQQRSGKPFQALRRTTPSRTRDEQGRKHCARCGQWKTESDFHRNQRQADGLETNCTVCARVKGVGSKYNITPAQYQKMLNEQNGGCAVCGEVPPGDKALHVDHDHGCCPGDRSCGKCVRALLCSMCNTAIGSMRDNPARLRAAADYLERF